MDLPADKVNRTFFGTGRKASRLGKLRLPGELPPDKLSAVRDEAEGAEEEEYDLRARNLVSKKVEYAHATPVTMADAFSGLEHEQGSNLENECSTPSVDEKHSQQHSDSSLSILAQIKIDADGIYKNPPSRDKSMSTGQSGFQQIQPNPALRREAAEQQSTLACAQPYEACENNRSDFSQSERTPHTLTESNVSLNMRGGGGGTTVDKNFGKQCNREDVSFLPRTFHAPSLDEQQEIMTGRDSSIHAVVEMENTVPPPLENKDEGLFLRDLSQQKIDLSVSALVDRQPVMEHRVIRDHLGTLKVNSLPSDDRLQEGDSDDRGQHFQTKIDLGSVHKERNRLYENKTFRLTAKSSNDYATKSGLYDRKKESIYVGYLSAPVGKQKGMQSNLKLLPMSDKSPNTDVDTFNRGLGNDGDQSVTSKSQICTPSWHNVNPESSVPEYSCSDSDLDPSNTQPSNKGDDAVVLQAQRYTHTYAEGESSGLCASHGGCSGSDSGDSNGRLGNMGNHLIVLQSQDDTLSNTDVDGNEGLSGNVDRKAPLENIARTYDWPNPNAALLLKTDGCTGIVLDEGHAQLHVKCGHTSLHNQLRRDIKNVNGMLLHSDDIPASNEYNDSHDNEQMENNDDHTCLLDRSMCTKHFQKITSPSTHICGSSSHSDLDRNNEYFDNAPKTHTADEYTQNSPSRSSTPPCPDSVDHANSVCVGSDEVHMIDLTAALEIEKENALITANAEDLAANTSHSDLDNNEEPLSIRDSECWDRPTGQDDGLAFKTFDSDRHSDESPEGRERSMEPKRNFPLQGKQAEFPKPADDERMHSSRAGRSNSTMNDPLISSPVDSASCRRKNYTIKGLYELIAGTHDSDESAIESTCSEFPSSQGSANNAQHSGEDACSKTTSAGVVFKKQQISLYKKLDSAQVDSLPMVFERVSHTELMLRLRAVWDDSGEVHEAGQARLRDKLRLMESEPAELAALFTELSVRLLSIHSDTDSIAIMFNTAEELRKFTTYYSLGLVSECLKIALLSDEVWLLAPSEDEVTIQIDVNEESMKMMHLNLLLQEGRFYVRARKSSAELSAEELELTAGDVLLVERAESPAWWVGRAISSAQQGLIPRSAVVPLQHFHEWFLKSSSISDCFKHKSSLTENGKMGTGSCVAAMDYKAECGDELSFKQGDRIEVEGLFIPGLHWLLGKVTCTERVGFVRMSCIWPDQITDTEGAFLHVSERFYRGGLDECTARHCYKFLSRLTGTDISTVYRIYQECHSDVGTEVRESDRSVKSMKHCGQDKEESFEFETTLNLGLSDHVLEITVPHDKVNDASVAEDSKLWFSVELTKCGDDSDNEDWSTNSDSLVQFLAFLNMPGYRREFAALYKEDRHFLGSLLRGHTDDTELVHFLQLAREAAKKRGMQWAQVRACFLLGRACANQGKFSQARVYYEESLSMRDGDFPDIFLMAALYTNLTSMYLKVMNKEKTAAMIEKTASLLISLPGKCIRSFSAQDILKHLLCKAILHNDLQLEGRVCFLIADTFLSLNRQEEALPYIERLQDLTNHFRQLSKTSTSSHYFLLNRLYTAQFPRLSVGSMMRACDCNQMTITECIRCAELIMKSERTIQNRAACQPTISPLCAPFLYKALQSPREEEHECLHNYVHNYVHLSLAELYLQQHEVHNTMCHLNRVSTVKAFSSVGEAVAFFLKLAWMYVRAGSLCIATKILEMPELGSRATGVVHNLLGIVHARHHNTRKAVTHFQSALAVAASCGEEINVAICHANLGFLAVNANAHRFAEICFLKALHEYFSASHRDHEEWFIHVLVKLGQNFYTRGMPSEGLQCYEMALLVALKEKNIKGQVHVTALLCQQYSSKKNDPQCIIYYEYQLNLARSSRDKRLEGDTLQTLSHIYHELGQPRDNRKAVEYVKRSLAIFIDLRDMERTAEAWLLAGTIYSKLGQNEIVDLHLQMAVEVALTLGEVECALHVYEAAGDVFFNSNREPEKAVVFYQDYALPLARHLGDERRELRLCHKLSELHGQLGNPDEVMVYSTDALQLSVKLGEGLSEKVTYHRLGLACVQQGRFQLAEHHFLRALALCTSCHLSHDELFYCMHVCLQLGDLASDKLRTTEDSLAYYNMGLLAALELGNKQLQLRLYERLASVYHNQVSDRVRSLYLYQQARALANELNVKRINLSRKTTAPVRSKQHC